MKNYGVNTLQKSTFSLENVMKPLEKCLRMMLSEAHVELFFYYMSFYIVFLSRGNISCGVIN